MDIGAELRAAREAKGLSVGALAERTRVPARTLSAIERNDRSALPPQPFARGFVRTYADELDLDHERVVREFFAQFPAEAPTGPLLLTREIPDASWQPPSRWLGMATSVAILLVVVTAAVDGAAKATSRPAPSAQPATRRPRRHQPARLTSRLSRQRSQQTRCQFQRRRLPRYRSSCR